jgi:hypothetical protein
MSIRTWRTPLLYHAFKHEVKCLTEELPSPHVDDGYLAHEDSKGSIRRLVVIVIRTRITTIFIVLLYLPLAESEKG